MFNPGLATSPIPPNPRNVILSFGEILWDVVGGREYIGGAPFNLAAHAVRNGLGAELYSRIGRDDRGRRARDEMRRNGVGAAWLQEDPQRPTGWVDVVLEHGEPTYHIGADAAWDAIEAPFAMHQERLRRSRFRALVCGTLAQRWPTSRHALQRLRALLPEVPVFYDVNLRPPHTSVAIVRETLPGVSVLKVNAGEASVLAQEVWARRLTPQELFQRVREAYGVKVLVLTRGAEGATAVTERGLVESAPVPIKLASAVGAGDAFSAAFLAGWLRQRPLEQTLARANQIGAWVASQPEAVPDYPKELAET